VEGVNSLLLRQVDPAGNVSDATTLNFVLDTTPPTLNPTFSTGNAFLLVNQKNVTVAPNASDQFGIASQSAGNVDTSTAGLKSVNCAATDMAGNTSSVDVPYTVGYAFVNVRPQPGASYPAKGTLTVSFQLSDANGVIKDSTAAKLVRNIVVNLDDAPRGSVKYNRRTDKFTVRLQLSKIPVGSHEMEIFVKVNGVDIAATGSIPFTVFPS
jgi:hypothetical protein